MRALGQSLAREFGPKGVHVAHVIVDGVIDIPRTKGWTVNDGKADGKIDPDAVSVSQFPCLYYEKSSEGLGIPRVVGLWRTWLIVC